MSLLPYKALMFGKEYTTGLATDKLPEKIVQYRSCIEGGRTAAAEALKNYANGDKTKLAHILGSGIRHIAAMCRSKNEVDDTFYCNGEMGRRMVDMLNRDPELRQLVIHNDDYALIKEDVLYINSINQAADIYTRAREAKAALTNPGENLSREQKTELLTDVMMLRVLNESKKMYHRSVEANSGYQRHMKEAEGDRGIKLENALLKEVSDQFTIDQKNRLLQRVENDFEVAKLKIKDLYHNDKLVASINNKKSVDALKQSVKELVKDSGLNKLDPSTALERMNQKKILQKLAAVTGKADEKASAEWAARVAEQKRERKQSMAERNARNAKKNAQNQLNK